MQQHMLLRKKQQTEYFFLEGREGEVEKPPRTGWVGCLFDIACREALGWVFRGDMAEGRGLCCEGMRGVRVLCSLKSEELKKVFWGRQGFDGGRRFWGACRVGFHTCQTRKQKHKSQRQRWAGTGCL